VSLTLVPITFREAVSFIEQHHRHHRPPRGCLFCIGVAHEEAIIGVAVVGRPVSRMLQDGWTAEVTRVATDGSFNGCSMLYGAAWRAVRAIGYRKLVTYTLPDEGGASLRGSGWKCLGQAGGARGRAPNVHASTHIRCKSRCGGKG
jgi:hypothetical protein